jgi:hypothetical protein
VFAILCDAASYASFNCPFSYCALLVRAALRCSALLCAFRCWLPPPALCCATTLSLLIYAALRRPTLCCSLPCFALVCCAVLCCVVLCCTVLANLCYVTLSLFLLLPHLSPPPSCAALLCDFGSGQRNVGAPLQIVREVPDDGRKSKQGEIRGCLVWLLKCD